MRRVPRLLSGLVVFIFLSRPCVAAEQARETPGTTQPHEVTIYRDTWGVPHIYADALADSAYALGYAQAEDRLEDIFKNIRTATGTMAEAFGPEFVDQDYFMRMVKNAQRSQAYWQTAPAHIRELGDSFVSGVEAYLNDHPDRRPEFAVELAGWHCMAVLRAMVIQWPFEDLKTELGRKEPAPTVGSNSYAVSPARSAEGCAILLTDPHLVWKGMAVFYEARVHAGDNHQCGIWLVGAPLPIMGHTGQVAWANTLGGPDTSDVYVVKLNPDNPLQYWCDGEWTPFQVEPITIPVKNQDAVERPVLSSIHGPLLLAPDPEAGVAYCGSTPYLDRVGCFEALYRASTARSCDEFYAALAMNELAGMNVMFADTGGNIQYVRIGRTPVRPEGYDWSKPVPGGTDDTKWLGIHDIGDLVQVRNPSQGYYQNCNTAPSVMFRDSPMTREEYPPYIYNASWDVMTPRGERLLQLLDNDDSVTKEEAMDYALDVYDILSDPWKKALRDAVEAVGADRMSDHEFASVVDKIYSWDGQFSRESRVAPIIFYWRMRCDKELPVMAIANREPLDQEDQYTLLDMLAETLTEMKTKHGTTNVKWGDINLIGRGGKFFGSPGVEIGGWSQKCMTETVMDVDTVEEPPGSGRWIAYSGSSSVFVSFLYPDGIESYSLLNWGQSSDPESPHYVDQAQKLYAKRKFKPTWFRKEELMKNLESEMTLTIE